MPRNIASAVAGSKHEPILIWPAEKAPEIFRNIGNPDDRDYVALIPKQYLGHRAVTLLEAKYFVCDIERHKLDDDYELWIGFHA